MSDDAASVSLAEVLNGSRTLPPSLALQLAIRVAEALDRADREGRGRGPDGRRVRLTPGHFSLAGDGAIVFTDPPVEVDRVHALWAAPEQVRDEPEDARAWVFSIATFLYESIVGTTLFHGANIEEAEELVGLKLDPHLLVMGVRARMRDAVPGLDAVVKKALDGSPDKRQTTLLAFAGALKPLLLSQPEGPDLGDFVRWNRLPPGRTRERDSLHGFFGQSADIFPEPLRTSTDSMPSIRLAQEPVRSESASGSSRGRGDGGGGAPDGSPSDPWEKRDDSVSEFWAAVSQPGPDGGPIDDGASETSSGVWEDAPTVKVGDTAAALAVPLRRDGRKQPTEGLKVGAAKPYSESMNAKLSADRSGGTGEFPPVSSTGRFPAVSAGKTGSTGRFPAVSPGPDRAATSGRFPPTDGATSRPGASGTSGRLPPADGATSRRPGATGTSGRFPPVAAGAEADPTNGPDSGNLPSLPALGDPARVPSARPRPPQPPAESPQAFWGPPGGALTPADELAKAGGPAEVPAATPPTRTTEAPWSASEPGAFAGVELPKPTPKKTGKAGKLVSARTRPIREIPPSMLRAFALLRRAVLLSLFALLGLVLVMWLGVFPALPSSAEALLLSSASSGADAARLPASVRAAGASLWDRRSDEVRARAVAKWTIDHLPADLRRLVRPPPPRTAALDWPGSPVGGGIVGAITGRLEADPSVPPGMGRVELSLSYAGGGMPLKGAVTLRAVPAEDPRGPTGRADGEATPGERVAVDGPGTAPLTLPFGFWDVEVEYTESPLAGGWTGRIEGVRASQGYLGRYAASVEVPAGQLRLTASCEGDDVSDRVAAAVYAPQDGAAVFADEERAARKAEAARDLDFHPAARPPAEPKPIWEGLLRELPSLPAGPVSVRITLDDSVHWPTIAWARDLVVPSGMRSLRHELRIDRGEPIRPTGPGLKLKATNFGEDVSPFTEVFLYMPGDDVTHAAARHRGRGGRYFDALPGTYDARFVFEPAGAPTGTFGEKVVTGFVIEREGVTQRTVEIGFPFATLDLAVTEATADISDLVHVRVVRPGADRMTAKPVIDEEGVGRYPLPAGTYDIYLDIDAAPGRPAMEAAFRDIVLQAGERWQQRWDTARRPWTAAPPRRGGG
jgi:hypothetical protein